jgi:hypothetical protein
MYIKKVEFFQNRYPQDRCLSGIVLTDMEGLAVGTPIIAKIDPFLATVVDEETGMSSYYKDDKTRTTAEDLRRENPKIATNIIARSLSKISVLQLFCSMRGYYDYNEHVITGVNFYPRPELPLIYGSSSRHSVKWISEVVNKPALRDIDGFLSDCFKVNRYLNITLTGLGRSKKADLMGEINTLANALKSEYPHSKALLQTADLPRILVDVMSISFYSLVDVIPVYDVRRTKGVVLEFTLTSSAISADVIPTSCSTYRFIFSKHKDGVFSIDGEKISRPGESQTEKAIELVCSTLANSMPNDQALKPKSKKVSEED